MYDTEERRQERLDIDLTTDIGTTGLRRFGGLIYEEFQRHLRGVQFFRTMEEMTNNDPVVGAILFAIENLVRQVEWNVEPAEESVEALDDVEFIEGCLDDLDTPFESSQSEAMTMLSYGFAPLEINYKKRDGKYSKYRDGKFGWESFSIRSQDTVREWDLDRHGKIFGLWQMAPPNWERVYIPSEKFLLFRTSDRKNNPQGRTVLRNAFRPWYFKKIIEEIEAVGLQRDLTGLPMAFVPWQYMTSGASAAQQSLVTMVKKIVTNVRMDAQSGIVMPQGYDPDGNKLFDFSLISATGSGKKSGDTSAVIDRYDRRIAGTVLADFLLVGQQQVGSFALVSSRTNLFATTISIFLQCLATIWNRYAIPRLFEANGLMRDAYPKMIYSDIETPDLESLGTYISQLSTVVDPDVFQDEKMLRYLLRVAGLPEPETDLDREVNQYLVSQQRSVSAAEDAAMFKSYIEFMKKERPSDLQRWKDWRDSFKGTNRCN